MVVLHMEAVPDHLRGYCSRFLVETTPGLFVGTCSPVVAENLWERVRRALGDGAATLIRTDRTAEAGYLLSTHGRRSPVVVDLDGLQLVQRRQAADYGVLED